MKIEYRYNHLDNTTSDWKVWNADNYFSEASHYPEGVDIAEDEDYDTLLGLFLLYGASHKLIKKSEFSGEHWDYQIRIPKEQP